MESQNREDETIRDQEDRSQYNTSEHQSKDEAIIGMRAMDFPNINDSTDCDTKIFDLQIVHMTVSHNDKVAHTDHANSEMEDKVENTKHWYYSSIAHMVQSKISENVIDLENKNDEYENKNFYSSTAHMVQCMQTGRHHSNCYSSTDHWI